MGNASTCKFVDENGVRCGKDCPQWPLFDIRNQSDFCVPHKNLLYRRRREEQNKKIVDNIAQKYGEPFVQDVREMYLVTPIAKISSAFQEIVKKHGLVDDGIPYDIQRTVFKHDMDGFKRVFESQLPN